MQKPKSHGLPIRMTKICALATLSIASALALAQASSQKSVESSGANDDKSRRSWHHSLTMPWATGEKIEGSGKSAVEQRALVDFEEIAIDGNWRVILQQGSQEGVTLQGDENLLPYVEANVKAGKLILDTRRGFHLQPSIPLVITIDLKGLRKLSAKGSNLVSCQSLRSKTLAFAMSGSGDLKLDGLDTERLDISLSGSGSVTAQGSAAHQNYAIAGSGSIYSSQLQGEQVSVNISGSGNASVNAQKSLSVSVAGMGRVNYSGEAKVTSSIVGMGKVRKL